MDCCTDGVDATGSSCGAPPCLANNSAGSSSQPAAPLAGTGSSGSHADAIHDAEAAAEAAAELACGEHSTRGSCKSDPHCTWDSAHGCMVQAGVDWSVIEAKDWGHDGYSWGQGSRDRSGNYDTSNTRMASRSNACSESGGIIDPLGTVCCSRTCGTCGGEDCASREGGAESCCADNIASASHSCGSPPCVLGAGQDATAHAKACELAGGITDATGLRCCSAACGTCGGTGCGEREGGAASCCTDNLDAANVLCGDPPCLMESKQIAQARNSQGHGDMCAAMGGIPDPFGLVCCKASCGSCGGDGCLDRDGGAESCCSDGIVGAGDECGSPPCMWPVSHSVAIEREVACAAAGGISDPTGMRCCSTSWYEYAA